MYIYCRYFSRGNYVFVPDCDSRTWRRVPNDGAKMVTLLCCVRSRERERKNEIPHPGRHTLSLSLSVSFSHYTPSGRIKKTSNYTKSEIVVCGYLCDAPRQTVPIWILARLSASSQPIAPSTGSFFLPDSLAIAYRDQAHYQTTTNSKCAD